MSKQHYEKLDAQLTGRCANSRKVANNTYLVRRGEDIAVMLHATDVFTIRREGQITLNSGGWKTPTTKDRINNYLPGNMNIYQEKGQWYITNGWTGRDSGDIYLFEDGMVISPKGTIFGKKKTDKLDKNMKKWTKQVNDYCKELLERAFDGRLPKPSGGDCWYCCMQTQDGEVLGDSSESNHVVSHVKDNYFVPSLFWNAMKEGRGKHLSIAAEGNLAAIQQSWSSDEKPKMFMLGALKHQYLRAIKVYVKKRVGLPY